MPSVPGIPGKGLVTGTGCRAGRVAAASGLAVIAIGGYVLRRLVRRDREEVEEKPPPLPKPPRPDPPKPMSPEPEAP